MATLEEIQELANRGLQGQLAPEKRIVFDEMVSRGLVVIPEGDQEGELPDFTETGEELNEQGVIPKAGEGGRPDTLVNQLDDVISGAVEPVLSFGSAILAEPIAGLEGIVLSFLTGDPEAGEEAIETTRDALTFKPRTQAGAENLQSVGEVLQPLGEAIQKTEQFLGDTTFRLTGSPTLAAAATTMPTAIMELLGFKGTQRFLKGKRVPGQRIVQKAIKEAAPSIDDLKNTSRAVFKEIQDLGGAVKSGPFKELVGKIRNSLKEGGFRPNIDTDVAKLFDEFEGIAKSGKAYGVADLDDLRTVAQGFANSLDPKTSSLGVGIIDTIDSYLDAAGNKILQVGQAGKDLGKINVGRSYKVARGLWRRARHGETFQKVFERAARETNPERAIRNQIKSLLNSEKKSKFFTKKEKAVLDKFVKGGKGQNIMEIVGKFGIDRDAALLGLLGATFAGFGTGAGGGFAVPTIGTAARFIAKKMLKGRAEFADAFIRAGTDAEKITRAYIRHVPKAKRSAEELSLLLLRPGVKLSKITGGKLVNEAALLAIDKRKALQGAVPAGAATQAIAQEGGDQNGSSNESIQRPK